MENTRYIAITATEYLENPDLNYATFYFTLENPKLEIFHHMSFEEAVAEINKFEAMGFKVEHEINPYNRTIHTHAIHGFLP